MSGPSPRHSRLVIVVRGLDGPERGSLRRLGHDVIDVMRPRDPGVRVREAGSHSKARGLARTAERRMPLCCILGGVEPGHQWPVPSQIVEIVLDSLVLST
jgi:hypothetical protein